MTDPAAPSADPRAQLRRSVYFLLIALGTGVMLGRIFAVDSVNLQKIEQTKLDKVADDLRMKRESLESEGISGDELEKELARCKAKWLKQARVCRPFLGANDRSRWCTVRALVEKDMRVEDAPYAIDKVIQEPNWDTIDMVKRDGHLYSSKPPLLPTLMAAAYWPIHKITGATLGTHPYEICRFMLVLFNVVPLVIYFCLLARLVERLGTTDWGRLFVMAAAVFGTFLSTFAVTINNHLPAAVCSVAALYFTIKIWFDGDLRIRNFILAGLFASLAAFNEFTAASLFAALGAVLLWKAPKPTFLGFVPAAAVVAAAFFATNWIAVESLMPAYGHGSGPDNWYDFTFERNGKIVESYWRLGNQKDLDRGETSRGVYAMNCLVGHHGIFSLTPVWLLSFVGLGFWTLQRGDPKLRWIAAGIAAISLACIAFYLMQPQINRNYGGMTSGLRWMFWLAPLWLLAMLPAADYLSKRRWTRGLCLLLLALSVLSVSFPTWNPWTHPWLMVFSKYAGWGI